MSTLSITTTHEEAARIFCIDLAREFGVRAKHFRPATPQERRWLSEGIRPITQFDTVGDMLAEGLCK